MNTNPVLVQIMAWRRPGDKPLSEPMMIKLLTHIYVTRSQWVKQNWAQTEYEFGPLQWRHDKNDGVSNHQLHHCLLNLLVGCRSKKTSKLRVAGLCAGNSPANSPHKWPVTRKMFPFDDVIMMLIKNVGDADNECSNHHASKTPRPDSRGGWESSNKKIRIDKHRWLYITENICISSPKICPSPDQQTLACWLIQIHLFYRYHSNATWASWHHCPILALREGNKPVHDDVIKWKHFPLYWPFVRELVPGEFPAQRPVTQSFDAFFDLHPNKWLSKQWWCWWFETPSCPLWRHRNGLVEFQPQRACNT